MWKDMLRAALAMGLWVASIVLMIVRSVGYAPPQASEWSILFALGGCCFVGWHLLVMERARAETIAKVAVAAAIERSKLDSIN